MRWGKFSMRFETLPMRFNGSEMRCKSIYFKTLSMRWQTLTTRLMKPPWAVWNYSRNRCYEKLWNLYYELLSVNIGTLARTLTFDLNNRASLKFHWIQINLSLVKNFIQWNPDVTILSNNDMPGITNMLCPRFNDLRFNDIPDITMSF